MTSAVLILPDAYRDAGNAFGVSQGWGEDNFSVPLSADGLKPATHWGLCSNLPQELTNNLAELMSLSDVLISSFSDNSAPYDHWVETLIENGLQRVIINE